MHGCDWIEDVLEDLGTFCARNGLEETKEAVMNAIAAFQEEKRRRHLEKSLGFGPGEIF